MPKANGPEILECDVPAILPVLGIKSTVVFPLAVGNVQIALPENLGAVEAHPGEDAMFAVATLLDPEGKVRPENLCRIGVVSRIIHRLRLPDASVRVVLQGLRRIRFEEFVATDPFLKARVSCVEEPEPDAKETDGLVDRALEAASTLARLDPRIPEEIVKTLRMNRESPARFADLVPTVVPIPYADRRRLLETIDLPERLRLVAALLEREVGRARLTREVEEKTEASITRGQREVFLREQLAVIRRELGEVDPLAAEIASLEERIAAAKLPAEAREEAMREVGRLRTVGALSTEVAVLRNYLEWLLELPWSVATEEAIQVRRVRAALERNHFGLERVKERIVEFLAVRKLAVGTRRGSVLCFVGPPGTGKTSLGRSIAEALGRKFVQMSVGGVHDEAEIRGHRRTYVGAMPGRILQAIRRAGVNDPVLVLDEVDKMSPGPQGDPSAALLEVLDPEQNAAFTDHFLGVPFDLSRVLFVATANVADEIPIPLLDRMEVIAIAGYTDEEKHEIGRRHLLPRVLEASGLKPRHLRVTDAALRAIVRDWAREAGLRQFRRALETIARKVAVRVAEKKGVSVRVGPRELPRYLGPAVFLEEEAVSGPEVGVATGLAWTPDGGAILLIEALKMPGQGRTQVTGHLGGVMRESVEAAFSFVRSQADALGIAPEVFSTTDVHIHFPAGAIPKDGPSAGVAVAVAVASLLSDKPVRPGVAMTGEISLRGAVLPVGGVKEKVLAAHRAGMTDVVLPRRNEKDLVEVPREAKARVRCHLVERVEEVFRIALSGVVVARRAPREPGVEVEKAAARPEGAGR